jgi:thioesterase domain-containing protein
MAVEVRSSTAEGVELFAPLAPNINHRDTVFGGSASAAAILAAWSALYVRMRTEQRAGRIVIRLDRMSCERPIPGDFTAKSAPPDAAAWARALATLGRGRGEIATTIMVAQLKAARNGERIHSEPTLSPPMNSTDSVMRASRELCPGIRTPRAPCVLPGS